MAAPRMRRFGRVRGHGHLNKTSPRTFYAHHSAAISAAAAAHESLILESAATGLSSALLATP